MNRRFSGFAIATAAAVLLLAAGARTQEPQRPAPTGRDYPVQPVPFTSVHLNDVFWAPRIETNRTVTIPVAFQQCERTQRVYNFERAAAVLRGDTIEDLKPPPYPFDDSDLYKVIEGAAYTLSVVPDPTLDAYVDGLIAKIGAAQEADGYLYTTRTINPAAPHRWAGTARWQLERDDSHELYNLGHMFEAAVAHYIATGKRTFLDIAIKSADLLVATFGPGKRSTWPGHQITEMALVRLYRVTGNDQYLDLAKFLIDERGPGPDPAHPTLYPNGERANPRGLEYNQAQQKIADQSEPVGHAVRAMYMYAGMADVAALTGDTAVQAAGDRIWKHLVDSKLYLTGGIGAAGGHEGFGDPFDLPNMQAYNETCASVGMDYWNHRLFLLHGDAKYIDVMERTLYNGLVSGVALDGKTFFYPNPLESIGQHARAEWFGVACCPGNITRFLASVPGYIYAKNADAIYVNLFAAGTADIDLAGRKVTVTQETRFPWDGAVNIAVAPERAGRFTVNVRIPGWARNEAVPGTLYRFVGTAPAATIAVNGQNVPLALDKGYVSITRDWQAGDTIALALPMPVRRIVADDRVAADRGRVALQRGPIVYAAEWPDNADGKVRNIVLSDARELTAAFKPDMLNGVVTISGRATGLSYDEAGAVTRRDQPFVAIPYATWANRGRGQMAVWLAREDAAAKPTPFPTIATTSTVTVSPIPSGRGKRAANINDGEAPLSSRDSSAYFDWWPVQGSDKAWVEMTFARPTAVSRSEVYWFDDSPSGGVRVPASWRLLYKDGDAWKPVAATGQPGVAKDAWNRMTFTPVTTTALRIEIVMQPNVSAGVQEWKVR
ncbi:MAG: glycoside hydrolase family 127 protein [Acidobacteriota bacterium]|nr:glycoside hydrolase family 127 protein [Acidobacteriota bacterium]